MIEYEVHPIQEADRYDPAGLLDALIDEVGLADDAALAHKLGLENVIISMIRNRKLAVSASMLLLMQEATGLSVQKLKSLLGERRAGYRPACATDVLGVRRCEYPLA